MLGGHLLPMPVGDHRLRRKELALRAGAVVVDSTGPVVRSGGRRALKHSEIELLMPSTVIGPQRAVNWSPFSGRSAATVGSRPSDFLSLPTS
jgi:hypothetical protein